MSMGGQFPWKVQHIDTSRGPVGSYKHISQHQPLPKPPAGTTWVRDEETREWSLVKCSEAGEPVVNSSEPPSSLSSPPRTDSADGNIPVVKGVDVPNPPTPEALATLDIPPCLLSSFRSTECSTPQHPAPPKRSSSSILSEDAVEGVDYVIHTVLPADTFSGLCLRYKISALHLRRANRFSGTNLRLAPPRLVIPLGKNGAKGGSIRVQDKESPEYKLHELMAAVPGLSNTTEGKSYLLMSGWDVAEAIEAAKDDLGWERQNEELALRRSDMVSSQHGVVRGGSSTSGKGHGLAKSGEVEVAWRDEPVAISSKECDLTVHVDMAVPADPSVIAMQDEEKDEMRSNEAREGEEELRAPLLRRNLELPSVGY